MKKIFTLIALAAMALGVNAQTWNFSEWTNGTYTEDIVKDGLTVFAGESYTDEETGKGVDQNVTIDDNNKTVNGVKYTKRVKTGGAMTAKGKRCIGVNVPKGSKLNIIAMSSSSSAARQLWVGASNTEIPTTDNALKVFDNVGGSSAEVYTYENTDADQYVYISSISGGINFYAIIISSGDEPGEPEEIETGEANLITFGSYDAPFELAKTYNDGNGFILSRVGGSHEIDGNNQYFGDENAQVKRCSRLKTGGKSTSSNKLTLTIPADATLKVCVRSASSSASDRNVVLTQNGTELYNQVVQDADAKKVDIEGNITEDNPTGTTTVYPVISVPVVKGTVEITYPVGAVNFYSFELSTGGETGIETVKTTTVANGAIYNLAGQKVSEGYKGVVIQNGVKMLRK